MGSDTLNTRGPGDKIQSNDHNTLVSSLKQELLPRNSSGVVTDVGGQLGSATYRWDTSYIKGLVLGAIASGLSVEESAGKLLVKVGSTTIIELSKNGSDPRLTIGNNANQIYLEDNAGQLLVKVGGTTITTLTSTTMDGANLKTKSVPRAALNIGSATYFSASGSYSNNSTTYSSFSSLGSFNMKANRLYMITLLPTNGGTESTITVENAVGGTLATAHIRLLKNGAQICQTHIGLQGGATGNNFIKIPPSVISYIDSETGDGPVSYSFEANVDVATNYNIGVKDTVGVIYEIGGV